MRHLSLETIRRTVLRWGSPLLLASVLCSCASSNPGRKFPLALEETPEKGTFVAGMLPMPSSHARDGLLAMRTLIRFWDPDASLKLVRSNSADEEPGVPDIEAMTELAREHSLWAHAFYGNMEALESRLAAGVPVLVMVQDEPERAVSRRYLVVFGFNRSDDTVIFHDGHRRPVVDDYASFLRLWRPVRFWMMTILPPERADWKMSTTERASLARHLESAGDWPGALAEYEKAQENDPRNPGLMNARALILHRAGELARAESIYRSLLEMQELNAQAANNLAVVLVESGGNLTEAERWSRRALTLEPSNPSFLDTLGHVLLEAGRPGEAAGMLERALHRSRNLTLGEQGEIAGRLIRAYLASGQDHLARQVWQDQRRRDPSFDLKEDLRGSWED